MKSIAIASGMVVLVALLTGTPGQAQMGSPQASTDIGTRFTYQGRLVKNGQAVNGSCALAFSLFDASPGGTQVGNSITPTVTITDGLFTVALDFGASAR